MFFRAKVLQGPGFSGSRSRVQVLEVALFFPTCIKEIDQSHFKFRNAELLWRKIYSLNQLICFLIRSFCAKKKVRELIREEKMEKTKREDERRSKCWTVHRWAGRVILINITYNFPVDKKSIVAARYSLVYVVFYQLKYFFKIFSHS